MSRDRFAELQASQKQMNLPDLESGGGAPSNADMELFFHDVNQIQDSIAELKDNVARIEQLHGRQLQSSGVGPDASTADEELHRELDGVVTATSKSIKSIKGRVGALEAGIEASGGNVGDVQMRKSQVAALRRKFLDTAQAYQKIEQNHRQKIRERMERQYRIVNPSATQEEVDAMLAGEANVFAQDVLGTGRKGEARRALQEVQERHEDVRKIERTIMELAQLFQEMATMVEQQGDMLDSIEKSIGNAADYTEEAVVHLDKAIEHRMSSRKKLWILTAIAAVILLICGILIYLYLIKPAMAVIPVGAKSDAKPTPTAEPKVKASSSVGKPKKAAATEDEPSDEKSSELWLV